MYCTNVFRLNVIPIAIAVNIVTALTTDADKPAIIAKNHNNKTIKKILMIFPFLIFSSGFKMKDKINKIIPTCKPETAKICIAPAFV